MRLVFNVDQTKECRGQLLTVWCRLSQQIGGATVVLATMDTLQTNRADRVTRRDAGEDRETGGNAGHLHTISFHEHEIRDLEIRLCGPKPQPRLRVGGLSRASRTSHVRPDPMAKV